MGDFCLSPQKPPRCARGGEIETIIPQLHQVTFCPYAFPFQRLMRRWSRDRCTFTQCWEKARGSARQTHEVELWLHTRGNPCSAGQSTPWVGPALRTAGRCKWGNAIGWRAELAQSQCCRCHHDYRYHCLQSIRFRFNKYIWHRKKRKLRQSKGLLISYISCCLSFMSKGLVITLILYVLKRWGL